MAQKVFPIDEMRARLARRKNSVQDGRVNCYCEAPRVARSVLANELSELREALPKPEVLCLESLESGIPVSSHGWDFIYSTALFTSLPFVAARQVIKSAVKCLRPGGTLIISNVSSSASAHLCSRCRGAAKNYRSEQEMVALAEDLPVNLVTGQTVFRDRTGLNVYLELHKVAPIANGNGPSSRRVLPLERVVSPAI